MSFLVSVEDGVGVEGQELFQYLRNQVEIADDAEGLPEAFTHSTTTPGRLSARQATSRSLAGPVPAVDHACPHWPGFSEPPPRWGRTTSTQSCTDTANTSD
jgi:hypothetical protein